MVVSGWRERWLSVLLSPIGLDNSSFLCTVFLQSSSQCGACVEVGRHAAR